MSEGDSRFAPRASDVEADFDAGTGRDVGTDRAAGRHADSDLDPGSDPDPGLDSDSDPDPDTGSAFDSRADSGVGEPESASVTVRNGDDADRTVSVSIVRPDGSLIGGEYRLASGRTRVVALGDSPEGWLGIDVDAGAGGMACVSLDSSRSGDTVPDFLVRGDRVSVSGLSRPSDREADSDGERDGSCM